MKRRIGCTGLLGLALLLTACASATRSAEQVFGEPPIGMVAPEAMSDLAIEESVAVGQGRDAVSGAAGEFQPVDRVVIRTANLAMVVPEPAASVREISELAQEMGGFVVSSNTFQQFFADAGVSADQASITIRVPSERLDEALERIKEGATEVQRENISGEDVTQEFTDLQSRLRNLEAAEEQLLEIMSRADETEDVLAVFENLRQVREEIEVIQGRIQYISESARLSAISVELIPDVAAQPLDFGGYRPEGTVKDAFTALIRSLRFLGDAAIWGLICVVPIALILGVPTYFAARTIIRRRRSAAKAEVDSQES